MAIPFWRPESAAWAVGSVNLNYSPPRRIAESERLLLLASSVIDHAQIGQFWGAVLIWQCGSPLQVINCSAGPLLVAGWLCRRPAWDLDRHG
jgi:hypothetical protein